jgi:hypothetical protein
MTPICSASARLTSCARCAVVPVMGNRIGSPIVGDQASPAVVLAWRSDRYTASGLPTEGGQMALREHAAGTAFPGAVGRDGAKGTRLTVSRKRITVGMVNQL